MSTHTELVHVAAAAIIDGHGRVLLSLRPDHVHQGGLWEFPGGKVEAGEQVVEALKRELHEEVGVEVEQARPLIRIRHRYPDREVLLDVWRVDRIRGSARGREGQVVEWVEPSQLQRRSMPAADVPIVNAVRLPSTYLITGDPVEPADAFLGRLERALQRGVRLVQLRAKALSRSRYEELARAAVALCHGHGAQVLLNNDADLVETTGADGVHLNGARLAALTDRPLPEHRYWVAASCHNLDEVRKAEQIGADFVVLAPVLPTLSHPDAVPLGWDGLRRITDQARLPVFALGGMTPAHLAQCYAAGAQGIAAIRALWGDET